MKRPWPPLGENEDGSADLYFGPTPPTGTEANWTPTNSAEMFEVLIRFYGPEQAQFDKKWVLPDIEAI